MNSRLLALSKMGVVPNFEAIQSKRIIIVGVGGVGSVAAEMLARCGVGELVLFDYDTVEEANMNRMFYVPSQIGQVKVDAASATLRSINPSVKITTYNINICSLESYKILVDELRDSDLLLCCVDNYAARLTINRACVQTNKTWMESGVSETAMSGHIQTMVPGVSACFECAMPTIVAEGGDEQAEIIREGVCAASLPTTMSIIAGLLVQNVLKFLLEFGSVCDGCLGYDALTDFFPSYPMKPNPDCINHMCKEAQGIRVDSSQEPTSASRNATVTELIGRLKRP